MYIRDFLRSRKGELFDRLWLGGEGFQQFRQRPIAPSGALKTRVLAIFGNHYRGNPRRPAALKPLKLSSITRHRLASRFSLSNVVRYTAGCGLPCASSSALQITSK